jgi:hypothetical protein
VPRADDGVAVALALVERPAEVRARRRDRADAAGPLRARDDHGLPVDLDAAEHAVRELRLVQHRLVVPASALPRRPVHAHAEAERELAPEMGGEDRAEVRDAGEHAPEPPVAAPPRREGADVQRQPRRVEQCVHHAELLRLSLQVAPVVQPRERCGDGGEHAHRQRAVGRLRADDVEQRGRGPRAERHVGERRVERRAEPDAVEQVAHRLRQVLQRPLDGVRSRLEGPGRGGEGLREAERHPRSLFP